MGLEEECLSCHNDFHQQTLSNDCLNCHVMDAFKPVTNFDHKITVGKIVETEAYRAPDDKACHAYGNKLTNRTKTMFEKEELKDSVLAVGVQPGSLAMAIW